MSRDRDPSNAPLILALDIGTSSVRALLYDGRGRPVPGVRASQPTPLHTTPDGGAEIDPGALVEAAGRCLEAAGERAGRLSQAVAAVAVCTFWHGLLGLDAAGRPITPIYTWADTRAAGAARRLRRRLDERAVHARTGCHFHTSYWPAKLDWLRRSQPDLFGRVWQWLSAGEFLFLCLFGTAPCSLSMASGTGVFDQNRLDWDGEVLSALSLGRERLPLLVDRYEALRGLRPAWRQRLGWLAEVPWFPALGDGACNSVGSGCVSRERIALMVGTSGAMRLLLAGGEAEALWGLWCYRADRQHHLVGGALSNGGNLYAWLRDTLRLEEGPALERELAALEPDGHGLTVLPFVAGERNPGYAANATGVIDGLRWHTRPVEILQAGMEAVAYRFAVIHELLAPRASPTAEIVASGAALVQSAAWTQIMADVLGRPVIVTEESEASSRGVALLAAEALGWRADLAEPPAVRMVYRPDAARHEPYRAALTRHRRLYRRMLGRRAGS